MLSSSFANRLKKYLFLAVLLILGSILLEEKSFAGPKIEIRFSAAVKAYRKNHQDNQPLDSIADSAAYDMLWRGEVTSSGFKPSFGKILYGGGSTNTVYKIGGGTCTGTLSVNSDMSVFYPGASLDKGKVTMSIQLPHAVAASTLTAYLMDKNQPEQSACRTASAEMARATCFNPTRDCFTVGGSINPDITILPTDETPFSKFLHHKDTAYFQFNDQSPDVSIPFNYTINNEIFDHLGNVGDTYKIVAAGFFTVRSSPGPDSPTPVDPFTFLGGGTDGPPDDSTPPTNPFGGGGVDIVGGVVKSWMSAFGPHVKTFSQTIQALNSVGASRISPRTVVDSVPGITFDTDTRNGTISTSLGGTTPASGVFQIKIKALPPEKAQGYRLTIPKKAPGTTIVKDTETQIAFSMDPGSLKLIQSGKAAKVFYALRLTPSSGKQVFEKQFTVSLKKRKAAN